ncbi:hypothetical protein BFO01nite_36360 [Brevibacillus formosus]|uniref:Transposase n=1 Tax=Brevibacillus formosus TaxID=54913 RepID=A0ABQ0TBM3_9BACL|nr:hypothetical protein BFO01nite_36360 [Brevibacillus formosus]
MYLRTLKGKFGKKYLCDIHVLILGYIYHSAIKMWDEDISKENFHFTTARFYMGKPDELLNKLKQKRFLKELSFDHFVDRLTYYLMELNVLPFRERNGRVPE